MPSQERQFHSAWVGGDEAIGCAGSASHLFPWWSFTKTVLAIGALRLVEDGRLDLDAPCAGKPYTLRHLLQHRAGVPNYGSLQAYHAAVARNETPWPRKRLLQAVGAERLDFPPGTGWAYSNVGYMFVRDSIEEVTSLPLASALDALVFAGLGMTSVRLATAADFKDVFWPRLRDYNPGWVYHGCLVGTAIDAAKLLHAVFRGAILRSESLATMLEPHDLGGALPGRPWTRCGYGLGLMIGLMGEAGRALGHSGAGPFSVNAVYHFPDLARPVTVAVFADAEDEGEAEHAAVDLALRAAR
ncbi:MAG TPA: serine hydrolase domain-containing protein, partial [Acetobacteraceae bacterium]|nr:serine hydrolase domain-containing protein [Acetobacteraceae bacterium]